MTDAINVELKGAFNNDLLLELKDQTLAKNRWAKISECLINQTLTDELRPIEKTAKKYKKTVQNLGSWAVALSFIALVASVMEEYKATSPFIHNYSPVFEICAVVGLILAFLASRHFRIKQAWLKNRFVFEISRQWHFRQLLNVGSRTGLLTGSSKVQLRHAIEAREKEFRNFFDTLVSSAGTRMGQFVKTGNDPITSLTGIEFISPPLPLDQTVKSELLNAYYSLRLEHQIAHATRKLSAEDETFMGFSNEILVKGTNLIASCTILLAVTLSFIQLFFPGKVEWASTAVVLLAILGVAIRAWREGLAVSLEREGYSEYCYRLEALRERWKVSTDDELRFKLCKDIEQAALEELRYFIRIHDAAQFIF